MIEGHRRRHRLAMFALAPVALLVLILAVADRELAPTVGRLPDFAHSGPSAREPGARLWTREDLFVDWPARVVAYQGRVIELKLLRALIAPDVLLYWAPRGGDGTRLPDDAHLLGKLGGTGVRRFILPTHDVPEPSGALFVYSLGHQEILGHAELPAFVPDRGAAR